jgi:hypothetical protein
MGGGEVLGSVGSAAAAGVPGTTAFNAAMGGLVPSAAGLGEAGYFAGAGMGAFQGSGPGLINQFLGYGKDAVQYAKDHPLTTLSAANYLLGGGQQQQQEAQDWVNENAPGMTVADIAGTIAKIAPSGAPLTDRLGTPVWSEQGLLTRRFA